MELSNALRGQVLVEALPYIQKYSNKIVVIKYGGNAMINEELKDAVMGDIALLSQIGIKVVLVHGGGPEINDMLKKINKESKFVDGLRYTDEETMEIVQMVLAGKVNKDLVALLEQKGGKAIGLCGIDGGMIKAVKHREKDIGYVGDITDINIQPVLDVINSGYIPVISSVAGGDHAFNVNADLAASRKAVDHNLLPYNLQVGLTGNRVSPPVYIAVGVSGAVHHIAGMQNAGTVIAINPDPDASIFQYADYGILAEFSEIEC